MHWTDTAILLSARKHGETSAVARVFSREHGVYTGVVRGAHGKGKRGVIQSGNVVSATWQARLPQQLGTLSCELLQAHAALLMQDAGRLAALSSACALIEAALPERHPYAKLYNIFEEFLGVLRDSEDWPQGYVRLELELLAEAGFGLDLSCCAATGTTEDLIYVSPKSGRAVSRSAGEPYRDRLLPLPRFLRESPPPVGGRVREGVNHCKPNRYGSHALIPSARELRREMTEAEKRLWFRLRAHRFGGYRFRRQHPVSPRYIADFICLSKRLIIELDGGQHAEQQPYDKERTAFLEQEGYRVLRFWNNEVFKNMEGVLTLILHALEDTPSLTLPPSGGGNSTEEILAGLRLTGYFLEHWLLEPHNCKLPAARERLVKLLSE